MVDVAATIDAAIAWASPEEQHPIMKPIRIACLLVLAGMGVGRAEAAIRPRLISTWGGGAGCYGASVYNSPSLLVDGDILWRTSGNHLVGYDLRGADTPVTCEVAGGGGSVMARVGDVLAVSDGYEVKLFDVRDPRSPRFAATIGRYLVPRADGGAYGSSQLVNGLETDGRFLYVSNRLRVGSSKGLFVIERWDVSHPRRPVRLAASEAPTGWDYYGGAPAATFHLFKGTLFELTASTITSGANGFVRFRPLDPESLQPLCETEMHWPEGRSSGALQIASTGDELRWSEPSSRGFLASATGLEDPCHARFCMVNSLRGPGLQSEPTWGAVHLETRSSGWDFVSLYAKRDECDLDLDWSLRAPSGTKFGYGVAVDPARSRYFVTATPGTLMAGPLETSGRPAVEAHPACAAIEGGFEDVLTSPDGEYVFGLVDSGELVVLDARDTLREVVRLPLPHAASRLALDGDRLLANGAKVSVLDVSAPIQPKVVATLAGPSAYAGSTIVAADGLVAIGWWDRPGVLEIWQTSADGGLERLYREESPEHWMPRAYDRESHRLYLQDDNAIRILDLADRALPASLCEGALFSEGFSDHQPGLIVDGDRIYARGWPSITNPRYSEALIVYEIRGDCQFYCRNVCYRSRSSVVNSSIGEGFVAAGGRLAYAGARHVEIHSLEDLEQGCRPEMLNIESRGLALRDDRLYVASDGLIAAIDLASGPEPATIEASWLPKRAGVHFSASNVEEAASVAWEFADGERFWGHGVNRELREDGRFGVTVAIWRGQPLMPELQYRCLEILHAEHTLEWLPGDECYQ